ncbi:MAG TPA: hypothetical protein VFN31_00365 [Candidatus Saccharimonadales bacterium]|nr:hypothetical protein [Candidatus Saccharimonadales bacterium]
MKSLTKQQLIDHTLASFSAEQDQDIKSNSELLHDSFSMTDMVLRGNEHLPKLSGSELNQAIKEAFTIKGRQYEFINIIADEEIQTVMVEFIESYPDPETNEIYCTPQIAVCIYKDGKIYKTRHYMDPRISRKHIPIEDIRKAID